MKRLILILTILCSAAYAQAPKGALNTNDVGVDQAGVCWLRGPANSLKMCGPTGAALVVTATTVLPAAGYWLVVPPSGTAPIVVNANGTSTAAGEAGNAYPIAQ